MFANFNGCCITQFTYVYVVERPVQVVGEPGDQSGRRLVVPQLPGRPAQGPVEDLGAGSGGQQQELRVGWRRGSAGQYGTLTCYIHGRQETTDGMTTASYCDYL